MVLPGDTLNFPFIFKSPNAGIFTETWELMTRPTLCGGAPIRITLRGNQVCLFVCLFVSVLFQNLDTERKCRLMNVTTRELQTEVTFVFFMYTGYCFLV